MIGSYKDTLGFNWDIATIPTNKVKYNTLHTGFYTINANSEKQDAAFKVIEYLMGEEGQTINSKASGNMSAIKSIAAEGAWKVEGAPVKNWDAITDALESGLFGYTWNLTMRFWDRSPRRMQSRTRRIMQLRRLGINSSRSDNGNAQRGGPG